MTTASERSVPTTRLETAPSRSLVMDGFRLGGFPTADAWPLGYEKRGRAWVKKTAHRP
jgi:hypothetical protein